MRPNIRRPIFLLTGTALVLYMLCGALHPLGAESPSKELWGISTPDGVEGPDAGQASFSLRGPADISGSIRGMILDGEGRPVEGAVVQIRMPGGRGSD